MMDMESGSSGDAPQSLWDRVAACMDLNPDQVLADRALHARWCWLHGGLGPGHCGSTHDRLTSCAAVLPQAVMFELKHKWWRSTTTVSGVDNARPEQVTRQLKQPALVSAAWAAHLTNPRSARCV
jgi:hypothetical protein